MFTQVVRNSVGPLSSLVGRIRVVGIDDYSCSIDSDTIAVEIYRDPRNDEITSVLAWKNVDQSFSGNLQTSVLNRLLNSKSEASEHVTLEEAVKNEIDKIAELIEHCRKYAITPRDLFYFNWGYQQAYSDYMIPDYNDDTGRSES